MHQLLQLRSTVQTTTGHPCTVETFLGGGGQGEVYRAQLAANPSPSSGTSRNRPPPPNGKIWTP